MELKDLVGKHELSGVDMAREKGLNEYDENEDCDVVRFVLDGKTYKAIEDPSDGYRSYCKDLEVCDEKVSNTFPPQKVKASMKPNESDDGYPEINDVIQFFDLGTELLVLEVGTANIDDYYPGCVIKWYPENLAINSHI